jgi:hypothetical protein
MKKKMGRPKLPKGSSREDRLYCRLLKSEVKEIEVAAKKSGKTKSEWIRDILLNAALTNN